MPNSSMLIAMSSLLLVAAGLAHLCIGHRPAGRWWGTAAGIAVAGLGLSRLAPTGAVANAVVELDSLAAWLLAMLGVTVAVTMAAFPACAAAALRDRHIGANTVRWAALVALIMPAIVVIAVTAAHPGVLWICAEIAVLATAVLIGYRRDRTAVAGLRRYLGWSVPASLCTAAGLGLLTFDGAVTGWVSWHAAVTGPPHGPLDGFLIAVGWSLVGIGFALRAVVAPLILWPAMARTLLPAPLIALPVITQLFIAGVAVLRMAGIDATATGTPLTVTALSTMAMALVVMGRARGDYQRAMVAALTGQVAVVMLLTVRLPAAAAVAWPVVALSSMPLAWCGRRLFALTGSYRVDTVRGLLHRDPWLGRCFTAALLLCVLAPAVVITRTAWRAVEWPLAVVAAGWIVLATLLVRMAVRMLYGDPEDRADLTAGPPARSGSAVAAVAVGLVACAILVVVMMVPALAGLPSPTADGWR
jgi:hydrogenase-4 component F